MAKEWTPEECLALEEPCKGECLGALSMHWYLRADTANERSPYSSLADALGRLSVPTDGQRL